MQSPRPESPKPSYGTQSFVKTFGRQRNPPQIRRKKIASASARIIQGAAKKSLTSSASATLARGCRRRHL